MCIRREQGFCCVQYNVCSDAKSFTLDFEMNNAMKSMVDSECAEDFILIPGMTNLPRKVFRYFLAKGLDEFLLYFFVYCYK